MAAAVVDLAEMAIEGDIPEGDPDYGYIKGASIDCIFYYMNATGKIMVRFLHPEAYDEPNFPDLHFSGLCSSSGSLLLSLPTRVFNPFTDSQLRILGRTRPVGTPRVLTDYVAPEGHNVFTIVCALPAVRQKDAYYFDVFHSDSNKWHLSVDEHVIGSPIVANTGIPYGTKAYWVTETPSIVFYDTFDDSDGTVGLPPRLWERGREYKMQLGRRGEDLCLVVATEVAMNVYVLDLEPRQRWRILHHLEFLRRAPPVPMRFESMRLQVLFWVDEQLFILEESWRNEMDGPVNFQIRRLSFQGSMPESPGDALKPGNTREPSAENNETYCKSEIGVITD